MTPGLVDFHGFCIEKSSRKEPTFFSDKTAAFNILSGDFGDRFRVPTTFYRGRLEVLNVKRSESSWKFSNQRTMD